MIVVSLMRAERVFASRELRALQELAPVFLATARRHWAVLDDHATASRRAKAVNGGVKSGHLAVQNQASGGALSAMARALAT